MNSKNEFNFIDGYKANFEDVNNEIDVLRISKLFFSTGPKWIDKIFNLRNKIVKFFGLKVSDDIVKKKQQLENFNCEVNQQVGLFKIFHKSENEVILGEDDKHLDFRVSMLLSSKVPNSYQKELTISTLVKFNNRFGKIYFVAIKPFHRFIVPSMLKGIISNINKENNR